MLVTQGERETVPLWNATQQSTISSPVNKRRDYSLLDHVWKTHDKKVHRFACHNWERGIIYYPFGTDSFEYLIRFLYDAWEKGGRKRECGEVWCRRSVNPWMRCSAKQLRHHLMKRSLCNCYKFLLLKTDFVECYFWASLTVFNNTVVFSLHKCTGTDYWPCYQKENIENVFSLCSHLYSYTYILWFTKTPKVRVFNMNSTNRP